MLQSYHSQVDALDAIVELYAMLEHGALALVEGLAPRAWLSGSYMWEAVLSDCIGAPHIPRSARNTVIALESVPTDAVRSLMERRLRVRAG